MHIMSCVDVLQAFQRLHSEAEPCSTPGPGSTPHKLAVEEVYESEPVVDEEEGAWREVAERIDPQGALARYVFAKHYKSSY